MPKLPRLPSREIFAETPYRAVPRRELVHRPDPRTDRSGWRGIGTGVLWQLLDNPFDPTDWLGVLNLTRWPQPRLSTDFKLWPAAKTADTDADDA